MKLSIGEVSKIFNISKETLRYYDKIGILKPETNEENGYRYYLFKDLEQLSLILGIKLLGISLADIKSTIESEDLNEYKSLVAKQEEILEIKKRELERLEYNLNKTKKILDIVTEFENEDDFSKLKLIKVEEVLYAIDAKKILKERTTTTNKASLESEVSFLNNEIEEKYMYLYNIIENQEVREDEEYIFIKANESNTLMHRKHLSENEIEDMKEVINGKVVKANFYGNLKEVEDYILSLNKYFSCKENNRAYIEYQFYLPKKDEEVLYFADIMLILKHDNM